VAKLLGNNYLLWVESSTPGQFNVVKGQGDMSETRGRDKIDLSDKTSAGYKLNAYGLSDYGLTLSVTPDLPDANGFTRLESQCNAIPALPFKIEIRKGGVSATGTDAVFAASVYGNISSGGFPKDGVVPRTVEFALAAAPTVDQLA
jgi:hypothetical protein